MSDVTKLGVLLDKTAQRDAVHIAVAPVVAAAIMYPGADAGFRADGKVHMCPPESAIGIVDPFLKQRVMPGDRFWLFLYPNTITSLRHRWTHPAFEEAPGVSDTLKVSDVSSGVFISPSVAWLTTFAAAQGDTYESLMEVTDEFVKHGILNTSSYGNYVLTPEFWKHYATVVGHPVDNHVTYFRCSC